MDPSVTKVTENPVTVGSGEYAVLRVLDADPSRDFTLLDLRRATQLHAGAVKVAASRLFGKNMVLRPVRGVYRSARSLVQPAPPDPRLRIHGLKLEARYQEGGWPYPAVFQRVTTAWACPDLHRHPNNHSVTGTAEWRTRSLTWTLHEQAGLLEVFLEASAPHLNLTLLDVGNYFAAVEAATGIPAELWVIRQADWNIDVPGSIKTDLSIEGLSIAQFNDLMLKVYQKATDLVRVEARSFNAIKVSDLTGYIDSIMSTVQVFRGRSS